MKAGVNPITKTNLDPYEDLLNAIIHQAVLDYESLISEAEINTLSTSYDAATMTTTAIRVWARGTSVEKILDKIDQIYKNEWKPYAKEHAQEIVDEWKRIQKITDDWERQLAMRANPHKCPLCGGSLKPKIIYGGKTISCNYCNLNILMPKGVK